ncbi:MAG: hypothetical protein V3R83_12460 [Gammaproteobacteria bacterium]
MPTRDNHSTQKMIEALVSTAIGSNTTTNGVIIDTADFDMGIKFGFDVSAFADGVFTVTYEDGDAANLSDAAAVAVDKVIGSAVVLIAATAANATFTGNGLFSTKRFVRAVITSTGVATGATISAIAVLSGENNPQLPL